MSRVMRWGIVYLIGCLALALMLSLGFALTKAQDPTATAEVPTEIVVTLDQTAAPTIDTTPMTTLTPEATVDLTTTPEATMDMTTTVEPTTAGATAAPVEGTAEVTSTVSADMTGPIEGPCDTDLILSLYVAERYFGFGDVHDMTMSMSTDTSMMVDLDTLDKGQFAPLFDNLDNMTPSDMMTDEQMTSVSNMMMMSDQDMMDQMATMMPDMSGMTMLPAGMRVGEPTDCANLRAELSRFYAVLAFMDLDTSSTSSSDTTTSSTTSTSENMNLGATLSGSNEVPGPGDDDGTGTAAVTLDMANSQVCYNFAVQNLALPATAAHIHRGAAGVKGDVVVPFDVVPDANGVAASCVLVDADLLNEIASNPSGFYVNVHTSEFPDGAIRGQLGG